MKNQKITITDRFIFSLVKSYNNNDKPFFASNEYLSKELNKSVSVISHSIGRLINLGYLINKGNKMCRQLYINKELLSAENNKECANFNIESAENSILIRDIKEEFAKNSNNKMLKTAIESAENSNILLSILISYTNIKEKNIKKEISQSNFGELKNVILTEEEYNNLKEKYSNLDLAIEKLDTWLGTSGSKNKGKNHYAYFKSNSWVWENLNTKSKWSEF